MARSNVAKTQKESNTATSHGNDKRRDTTTLREDRQITLRKCQCCGKEFSASNFALSTTSHTWCVSCRTSKSIEMERASFLDELRNRFDNISVVAFSPTMLLQSKFRCHACGNDFKARPHDVLSYRKDCCPKCAKSKGKSITSRASLNALLKTRGIKAIGEFRGMNKPMSFRCAKCKEATDTTPGRMIVNGCRICKDQELATLKTNVMKQVTKARGVSTSDVSRFRSPAIVYRWMGQDKEYLPDFLVKEKTAVTVESIRRLLGAFKANVEKAKAAIKSGYNYRVVVCELNAVDSVTANPSAILLPRSWHAMSEEEVRAYIWRKQLPVERFRLLAVDPGTSNFAWTVLDVNLEPLRVSVVATGMLQNPMKAMSGDISKDVARFRSEVTAIVEEYEVKCLAAERYMTRGIKGTTIEAVNAMLGVLITMFDQYPEQRYELVMASQWKNEWNRYGNLEAFYKTVKCEVHQADSMGIGLYCAYRWSAQKPFHDLKTRTKLLAKQLSANNVMRSK